MPFVARVCEHCGKAGGTMAFRLPNGKRRGYFHPKCFKIIKKEND